MEKIAIMSSTAPHLLSYLSTSLFSFISVEKGNLAPAVALREVGTQERHSQCNGQTAGGYKGASTPSPVFEEVVQLK